MASDPGPLRAPPAISEAPGLSPRDGWLTDTWQRQRDVVGALIDEAGRDGDSIRRCLWWLAVDRQARSYLRHLGPVLERGRPQTLAQATAHQGDLEAFVERSTRAVGGFEARTRRLATARLGARVAVMGKGGAGKTTIASTLARQLARRGCRVLAADLDTNPGLAMSLGMAPTEAGLPPEALEEREGALYGWQLAGDVSPAQAVERFSTPGPDGVRYIGLGKIASEDKSAPKRSLGAVLHILLGFGSPEWDVVADLEAGPTTPFERYHAFAEDVVIVVGPAWTSALTARRLMPMIGERRTMIVANRFGSEPDHAGLAPRVRIPFDGCVATAERMGSSPLDTCPDSPAVGAVADLAELIHPQEATA